MTAYLVIVAIIVAVGLGVWLVFRSREAREGSSGVDPAATHDEPDEPRERGGAREPREPRERGGAP